MTFFLIALTTVATAVLSACYALSTNKQLVTNHKSKIIGGYIAAAFGIALSMSTYTIQSGTVGVISTMGKYEGDTKQPGFHVKIPFIQKIYEVDVKQIVNQELIALLDSNNLPINMHISFKWRVLGSSASGMLSKYNYNIYENLLKPTIRKTVRDVVGGYNGESLSKDRIKLAAELESELSKAFGSYPDKFFHFAGLDVRNIKLDDVVMNKVRAVQMAKQKEKELRNEVLQKAQEAKKRKIDADTAYYEKKKQAQANAIAVLTEARAQAKANKLVAASLSKELIENNKILRWDGKLPKVTGSNKMNLFIPNEYAK